jgi:hypothetical protein
MSTDEEMAVIGRMVTEKKDLERRSAALKHEIDAIGQGLSNLSNRVIAISNGYMPFALDDQQAALLDLRENQAHLDALNEKLKAAGL